MAKILIVDDSALMVKIARSFLEKAGHTVAEAKNGREGVDKARAEKPAVIFLDAEMPEMGGREACEILKKDPLTRSIPIYIYSGDEVTPERKTAFEAAGADGVYQKPYNPSIMTAIIQKLG